MAIGLSDSATHAVSGAAGGCIAMAITYPLINLSTRSQVAAKTDKEGSRAAALRIIKRDGIVGLYDGLSSSLLGIAVTNGIYYLFFEEARAVVLKSRKGGRATLSTLESIAVSAFAGAATSIFSNPIWVINTRQTVRSTVTPQSTLPTTTSSKIVEKKLSMWQTILHILRTDGPMAFFSGLGPALILVSNPILQFTLFEQLKNFILRRRQLRLSKSHASAPPLTDLDFFLLGAITKLFATGTTYPYLTVKARLQSGSVKYSSSLEGLRTIIREEGISGLYRGIAPKLTQSVATAAILFLAKEKIYAATKKCSLRDQQIAMRFALSLTALITLATLSFAAKGQDESPTDVFDGGEVQTKLAWFPPITRPSGGETFAAGSTQVASWNRQLPTGFNLTQVGKYADLLLGYTLPDVLNYHLDVTLVKNISLYTGNAEIEYTLPSDLVTRDSYFLALIGSSSNISPKFTILSSGESTPTEEEGDATETWDWKRSKVAQKLRLN
ncbi:hypothetical protein JCM5353_005510 [Sporobolomyces roseus]